jgi:hypothetical protein
MHNFVISFYQNAPLQTKLFSQVNILCKIYCVRQLNAYLIFSLLSVYLLIRTQSSCLFVIHSILAD